MPSYEVIPDIDPWNLCMTRPNKADVYHCDDTLNNVFCRVSLGAKVCGPPSKVPVCTLVKGPPVTRF